MKKTWLIIQREFAVRVRRPSFLLLTFLGPILSATLLFLPAYLATRPDEKRVIAVLDEAFLLNFDRGKNDLALRYLPPDRYDRQKGIAFAEEQGDYGFLYIPTSEGADPDWLAHNIVFYRAGDVAPRVEAYLEERLEKYLQQEKLKASGVDPEIIGRTKTRVDIRTINTEVGLETKNGALLKMALGYLMGFLIYLFVFFFGAQVFRSVLEEKSNRIMEVMLASVKPWQLLSGKIAGIGLVAFLQYAIWIVLGAGLYALANQLILGEALSSPSPGEGQGLFQIYNTLQTINGPLLMASFLFFFFGGYLLYGALYAAVGSLVDKESDGNTFGFVIAFPLILAIAILIVAVDKPDGALAQFFSLFPFTSPIIMLARLPFGVPPWELWTSVGLLLLTVLAAVAAAGKIYRSGVLMYGAKPSFATLWKALSTG